MYSCSSIAPDARSFSNRASLSGSGPAGVAGAPITDLGTQAAKLAVFLTVALVIATLRFRKRLD